MANSTGPSANIAKRSKAKIRRTLTKRSWHASFSANLLHDYEQQKEAADTLEPLVKAVQGEDASARLYAKIREYIQRPVDRCPTRTASPPSTIFTVPNQYASKKTDKRARDELDLAIKFDPTDADVLIAMYHLPGSRSKMARVGPPAHPHTCATSFSRRSTRTRPTLPPYNQWAWLVSNTEGDFQKAIRYSHRSLELNGER